MKQPESEGDGCIRLVGRASQAPNERGPSGHGGGKRERRVEDMVFGARSPAHSGVLLPAYASCHDHDF